jgi:hypothetical protein
MAGGAPFWVLLPIAKLWVPHSARESTEKLEERKDMSPVIYILETKL